MEIILSVVMENIQKSTSKKTQLELLLKVNGLNYRDGEKWKLKMTQSTLGRLEN